MRAIESILSEDELTRAAQYRFEPARNEFMSARVGLREVLSCYLQVPASDIRFVYGAHGKPAIEEACSHNVRGLYFNISHTSGLAVCAISMEMEVGIDVERIRETVGCREIVRRFFPLEDDLFCKRLPPSATSEFFFKCWTAKEAYVKARGYSLADELERPTTPCFNADLSATEVSVFVATDGSLWSLRWIKPRPGYMVALVAQGSGLNVTHLDWY